MCLFLFCVRCTLKAQNYVDLHERSIGRAQLIGRGEDRSFTATLYVLKSILVKGYRTSWEAFVFVCFYGGGLGRYSVIDVILPPFFVAIVLWYENIRYEGTLVLRRGALGGTMGVFHEVT